MVDFKPVDFRYTNYLNTNNRVDIVSSPAPNTAGSIWGLATPLYTPEPPMLLDELDIKEEKSVKSAPSPSTILTETPKTPAVKAQETQKTVTPEEGLKDNDSDNMAEETETSDTIVSDKEITEMYGQILSEIRDLYQQKQESEPKVVQEFQNMPQVKEEVTDVIEDKDGSTVTCSEGTDEANGIKRSSTTSKSDKDGNTKSWERKIEYTNGTVEIFFYAEGNNSDGTIREVAMGKKTSHKDENGQVYWTKESISRDRNTGHFNIIDETFYDEAEYSGGWSTHDSVGNTTGRCNVHGYGNVAKRDYGYNDSNGTFHETASLIYVNNMGFMQTDDFMQATGWHEETPPSVSIQIALTDEKDMAEVGNYRTFETNLGTGEEYIKEEKRQDITGQEVTVRVHGYKITDENGEVVQEYREVYDQNREYLLQTEESGRNSFEATDIKTGEPTTKYRHFTVIKEYNCKAGSALRIPKPQCISTKQGIPGEVIRTTNTETGEDTVVFGKKGTPYDSRLISQCLQLS